MTAKGERLAKFIAGAGIASRRGAEVMIAEGRVKVNNTLQITPACLVSLNDIVEVDGHVISTQPTVRIWCFHKPKGVITTHNDPQGRPTVFSCLPDDIPRVISVGRLDINSEGLLILTNHGATARLLELPKNQFKRVYRVRIRGRMNERDMSQLQDGITIEGVKYKGIEIEAQETEAQNCWYRVTLLEGKNREIRKLMQYFGHDVSRLLRISYGPFELGKIQRGAIEEVARQKVQKFIKLLDHNAHHQR